MGGYGQSPQGEPAKNDKKAKGGENCRGERSTVPFKMATKKYSLAILTRAAVWVVEGVKARFHGLKSEWEWTKDAVNTDYPFKKSK